MSEERAADQVETGAPWSPSPTAARWLTAAELAATPAAAAYLFGWGGTITGLQFGALFVLVTWGGIALLAVLVRDSRGVRAVWNIRFTAWGWSRIPRLRTLAGYAALMLLTGLTVTFVLGLIRTDEPAADPLTSAREATITGAHGTAAQVGLILFACLLAPLLEEVAWRGYLLPALRAVIGNGRVGTVAAVAVTSVLFGLGHTQYGFIDQMETAFRGALYALIALRTRSLLAAWVAHACWNSMWTLLVIAGISSM